MADQLTDEQKEQLDMFKAVTQECDDEKCIITLTAYKWEMEQAILGFMQSGHVRGSPRRSSQPSSQASSYRQSSYRRPTRSTATGQNGFGFGSAAPAAAPTAETKLPATATAPIPAGTGGVLSWLSRLLWAPVRFGVTIVFSPLRFGLHLVSFVTKPVLSILGFRELLPAVTTGEPFAGPPQRQPESAEAFMQRYDQTYGPDHPPFQMCSFDEALRRAKVEIVPLLVLLVKEGEPQSDQLARTVLNQLEVIDMATENFLVWAASEQSAEGYRVAMDVLDVMQYPMLAAIVETEGGLHVLDRIDGAADVDDVMECLAMAVDAGNSYLYEQRALKEQRVQDQLLREEQDRAYAEALLEDRRKEEARLAEQRLAREEAERKQREVAAAAEKKEAAVRQRQADFDNLPAEPSDQDQDVARLVVKLPSGRRLNRRFKGTDLVLNLYQYVAGHPESCIGEDFVLSTHFPMRLHTDRALSLRGAGLAPSAVLFVQDAEVTEGEAGAEE